MSTLTIKLYDLASNELADISGIALEREFTRMHNQARQLKIQAPAGSSLFSALVADDGDPNLVAFSRKLIAWEDGGPGDQPLIHARIRTVERNGDGKQNLVTIIAADPLTELGYESDDQAGRPVRNDTGNFINPTFEGTGTGGPTVISGPDLIQQILTNSQNTDPLVGEGPLPISLTGDFDLDVPPAIDLNPSDSMDWPVLCGDFIQQLTQTGVCDIDLRPLDPGEAIAIADPYLMVEMSAVSALGTDRSATVHFDYWTGSRNASACRELEDGGTVNNKLFYYLGPRLDQQHWRANIAPDSPGVTPDPTASRAKYGGPDSAQFMSIKVFDSIGNESSSRPLYLALYNTEFGLRLQPRKLLYVTPNPGAKALFDAPSDFDAADLVAINTGADFGVALAESQRVYGYVKTWSRENVTRLSQLYTSADAG